MTVPRVTVVVPCFDGARFLAESIESVLAQTRPADEVIFVDDGSTDDSAAVAAGFPGVRVLRGPNEGVSAARNRGVAESRGELLVFHDADDRLLPHALEIGVREIEAHPECGFVYGTSRTIDAAGDAIAEAPSGAPADAGYLRMLAGDTLVPPSSAVFRREAFEAVGGFRTGRPLAEDYDFYLRVTRRFAVHAHGVAVAEYRRHGANASAVSPSRMLRALMETLDEHRDGSDPAALQAIEAGRQRWTEVFGPGLGFEAIERLRARRVGEAASILALAARRHPRAIGQALLHYARRAARR